MNSGPSVQYLFQTALGHHQAGRLAPAEALYRQVLQAEPGHPDTLNMLGLVARQTGRLDTAFTLINQAIASKPAEPAFHNSLGQVLRDQGKLDAALSSYRKAIALKPDHLESLYAMGNTLQMSGQLDEAISCYRRALAIKPDFAEALGNMGSAFLTQGKLDEAISCYRAALSFRPNYVEAHANLGSALQAQGQWDEAIACYRRALTLKPDYVKVLDNLGNALLAQGKPEESAAAFQRLVAIVPNLATAHNSLGNALQAQVKLDKALACYRLALTLNPKYAEAHNNLGLALEGLGQSEEAVLSYRRALDLMPDSAEVHSNLGISLRSLGKLTEAVLRYRRALELKPNDADLYAALSIAHLDLGQLAEAQTDVSNALKINPEQPDAWAMQAKLRKMTLEDTDWLATALRLTSTRNPPSNLLQFAIGKYYDDTGQYDLAFAAYQKANALKRQASGKFDCAEFSQLIDRLIANYPADAFSHSRAGARLSRCPVLIVGMPRSGTSLTEQIIASHPQAYGAGELAFWGKRANLALLPPDSLDPATLAKLAEEYEQCLQQHSPTAARIVDKMPANFLWLGLIITAFPHAKVIHTRRNPVDTCLSIYFQNFSDAHSYGTDLEELAFYYRGYARLMCHWRAVLPAERFLEVPYEALVDDQVGWSRRIIEFIELDWDERCLEFYKTERKVATASNWQVRQKIYASSKERWRRYEKHLGPLLGLLDLS